MPVGKKETLRMESTPSQSNQRSGCTGLAMNGAPAAASQAASRRFRPALPSAYSRS